MADKKDKEKIPILQEKEELEKLVKKYEEEEQAAAPGQSTSDGFSLESKEFKEFEADKKESETPHTFYEKAAKFAGKHLNIKMKEADEIKLNEVLYFIGYNIRGSDVMSLSILCLLVCMIASGFMLMIDFRVSAVAMMGGLGMVFFIQKYPGYTAKIVNIDTMNSMPLAITYIVIFMRTSPTLEGAIRFALRHLGGPLGRDMKKMLWNLESGKYTSMDEALSEYAAKWQDKNRYFANAIEIIRNSQQIRDEQERLTMLDKASEIVLRGNLETMQGFARGLKMPITALYMLCIVLPVMGLVIAPVMTSLMAESMSINSLIVVYDIALPVIVYFFIKSILSKRPGTFKKADISDYPGLAKNGRIMIKTKGGGIQVPLLPISLLVFVVLSAPGIQMLMGPAIVEFNLLNIIKAVMMIWGISGAIIIYTLGNSYQKLKIRNNLDNLESDLDVALFQLGDKLSMGTPIEHAMKESADALKKGPIRGLFSAINKNMIELGMPLKDALFDKEVGALKFYPSKLVGTVMEVLTESSKKGLLATSVSMKAISKYLENLKAVKSNIEELIGSIVSSMKFQAQFLTSFIAGIIIALNILLFRILAELGTKMTELSLPSSVNTASVAGVFKNSMFNVASMVPAEHMQLVVGVYMIQVTVLLSILINGVENGKDDIFRDYAIGTNLAVSTIVYTIALVFGIITFSSFNVGG